MLSLVGTPLRSISSRKCLHLGATHARNNHGSTIGFTVGGNVSKMAKMRCQYSDGTLQHEKSTITVDESPSARGIIPSSPVYTVAHTVAKVLISSLLAWLVSVSFTTGIAYAASSDSIRTSGLGLRIANFFQKSGFPNELIVVALASLPVIELRGAIPVGYWLQLNPVIIYILSVFGNMIPIPFVLLYLDKLSTFLADKSPRAKKLLDVLYNNTRRKAGPIQEFKWLGLMLFVAVPFPGTGAWTGAIASVVLGMPFWSSFWANFFGVLIAGVLVNLLVNLGVKAAVIVGLALFAVSTFMWTFLRHLQGPAAASYHKLDVIVTFGLVTTLGCLQSMLLPSQARGWAQGCSYSEIERTSPHSRGSSFHGNKCSNPQRRITFRQCNGIQEFPNLSFWNHLKYGLRLSLSLQWREWRKTIAGSLSTCTCTTPPSMGTNGENESELSNPRKERAGKMMVRKSP